MSPKGLLLPQPPCWPVGLPSPGPMLSPSGHPKCQRRTLILKRTARANLSPVTYPQVQKKTTSLDGTERDASLGWSSAPKGHWAGPRAHSNSGSKQQTRQGTALGSEQPMVVTLTPLPRGPAQGPGWSGTRGDAQGAWPTASPSPGAFLPEREGLSLLDPADSPWRGDKSLSTSWGGSRVREKVSSWRRA